MRRLALVVAVLAAACASSQPPAGPYSVPAEAERDTARAERLTREAADLILTDPARAEQLLREALSADLFHGPAHNNLGVVFLGKDELYEAAHEFEWARKLLPGQPDPRVNLAIVLERAGRMDEAFETYEAAVEVTPRYLPAVQGMARLVVREGREDARLAGWLERIAMEGEGARWREWAGREMARRSD